MCQFVPATGIRGYSLDLMRRDPASIPTDCWTSPCAPPSSTSGSAVPGSEPQLRRHAVDLSGDKGDGTVQRAERWFLKRLSNFAQIESLWRFNAKYEPEWLPATWCSTRRASGSGGDGHPAGESCGRSRPRQLLAAGAEKRHWRSTGDRGFMDSSFGRGLQQRQPGGRRTAVAHRGCVRATSRSASLSSMHHGARRGSRSTLVVHVSSGTTARPTPARAARDLRGLGATAGGSTPR